MACGSSATTDTIQPITGVTVSADSLVAGRGCGTGATQLYKYAVTVFARGEYVAGNVYDCFSDGTFVELPDIGSSPYTLEVLAYSRPGFVAAGGDAIPALLARLNNNHAILGTDAGGQAERTAIEADLKLLRGSNPTYTTTCNAEQVGLVQTLAVCKPLQVGSAGIGAPTSEASVVLSLGKFPKAGGGELTCDDQYVIVKSSYNIGATETVVTESRCSALGDAGLTPGTIIVEPAQAPASYVFTVTLHRADGSLVGTTRCAADTSPGLTSTAVCEPVGLLP